MRNIGRMGERGRNRIRVKSANKGLSRAQLAIEPFLKSMMSNKLISEVTSSVESTNAPAHEDTLGQLDELTGTQRVMCRTEVLDVPGSPTSAHPT
jgi:hypothetical protein